MFLEMWDKLLQNLLKNIKNILAPWLSGLEALMPNVIETVAVQTYSSHSVVSLKNTL